MFPNKQAESFPGRNFYQSKGIDWLRFIPWLILPFITAALFAIGMFALFYNGQYYVIILPLIAASIVGVLMILAVNKGHCRNPTVAAVLGCFAGVVLYLGYFYCGMVYQLGPETAARLDLLPFYIHARMRTDVIRDAGTDNDENTRPQKGDSWFNWFTFSFELIGAIAIPAGLAVQRARKPYCNACRKWMIREVTQFEPGQSEGILDAFRTGSARSLAALCAKPVFATIPNATLGVEICPTVKDSASRDCPVYASMKLVTKAGSRGPTRDPFDAFNGKSLLRSLQLNSDEIAALGSRFKIFETLAGHAAVAALKPESEPAIEKMPEGTFAEIRDIEPDYAGKVLTRRNSLIGLSYVLLALLFIIGSGVLAACGGIMAFPDKNSPQYVPPAKKVLGISMLSVGGALFAGACIFMLANPTYFRDRFLLRRAREEFSRRPKTFVDPNNPDALFVEIVPKLNWGRTMMEMASDVGFLAVNLGKREVLFEGDKQRFRVPADAITLSEVEFFVEGKGTSAATKIYYVVLRANRPNEFWEVPLRERLGAGKFGSRRRRKSTERLCEAIEKMRRPVRKTLAGEVQA